MIKVAHLDTETTGKDCAKHGIHQIAGGLEINGTIVADFDFKVQPYPTSYIEESALKVSGVTRAQIMGYENGIVILRKLCAVLDQHVDITNPQDRFFLSGWGVSHFDSGFLQKFFQQYGSDKFKLYFWNTPIDTAILSANVLRHERSGMQNFQLATVAKRFNIDVQESQLHNAAYDWKLSRQILNSINK